MAVSIPWLPLELDATKVGKKVALVELVAVVATFVALVAVPAVAAFRLATWVVEDTTRGAVPVATVEVSCPDTLRLVPVAAPMTGVTRVGVFENTTFVVPVVPETVTPWILATVEATEPGPVAVTSPVNAVM